jgi:hypothetical protein
MRGFVGILVVLLVALAAGAIGFQAGVATNVGANVGTAVPAYAWWGFPHIGGFLFGFLFLFLFIGLIVFAFRGPRGGPWGRGYRRGGRGYGPMGGPVGDPSDPRQQWMADAHRRLHEEEARRTSDAPSAAPGSAGSATVGTGDIPPAPPTAS